MPFLRLILLLALSLAGCLAAAADLEIITLKYRTVEQVIPVIRPLLEPGGTVSGMQNQLIVRTGKANLADIRKVLASIDSMPRSLMIYVRQDAAGESTLRGAEVSGSAGGGAVSGSVGGGGAVVGTSGQERRGVSARVYDSRSANDDRVTQQLQVLEGNPAFIQAGQSVPVPAQTVTRTINGVIVTDSSINRDISTGFQVVPRVSGERVFLDISARRDTPRGNLGGANVQNIVTTASGRLGEWFELGGINQDESSSSSGLLAGTSRLSQDRRRIWVKVEEIK